jgi:hypothetical protein
VDAERATPTKYPGIWRSGEGDSVESLTLIPQNQWWRKKNSKKKKKERERNQMVQGPCGEETGGG